MTDQYLGATYRIAQHTRRFIHHAASAEGVPLSVATCGAQAQGVAMLMMLLGREETARLLRQEADMIEAEKDDARMALAHSVPAGCA